MIGFEAFELVEERVELRVRDLGGTIEVITLFVMPDGVTKLFDTLFGIEV
jgi:hypothetical protein